MMSTTGQQQVAEELRRRLEKLSRHYDVDTMKVFMVVEALGESSLHAVYSPPRKVKWQSFLQRHEACRLDLARHDKTRERYHQFLNEVGREEQGRQWFQAVLQMLHQLGAADIFNYITNHADKPAITTTTTIGNSQAYNGQFRSPRRHEPLRQQQHNLQQQRDLDNSQRSYNNQEPQNQEHSLKNKSLSLQPAAELGAVTGTNGFCSHLSKLFEKKLETWFDSFQAVAVRLTAHVKVSGLVRVLSGQVHALCTRQGRLHAVAVKVTAQDTPRPLDVAELCLAKVMVIQNGLALPEDLDLALLTLHMHPARPVLRLWLLTPSTEMETAIRQADIDDMIDAGRLSQYHEMWVDNTTTDSTTTTLNGDNASTDNNHH